MHILADILAEISADISAELSSMINRHAFALIPNTLFALNSKISQEENLICVRFISMKTFLATDALHSIAIVAFVPCNDAISCKIMYSHISKLLAPVMASMPFNPLKFIFTGVLSEAKLDNVLLLTHGGFPTINKWSFSFAIVFKSKVKKSAFTIRTRESRILFSHVLQYSGLISIPIICDALNIKLLFIKLPIPQVGSIMTEGARCLSFLRYWQIAREKYYGV